MRHHIACVRYGILLLFVLLFAGCNGSTTPVSSLPTATFAPVAAAPRTVAPLRATAPAASTRADVPTKAYETLRYIQSHNGEPPPGYVGGTTFDNREGRLSPGHYKEYDVDPKMAGVGRNAERLVINQDSGQAYYTGDHYVTFIPLSTGR